MTTTTQVLELIPPVFLGIALVVLCQRTVLDFNMAETKKALRSTACEVVEVAPNHLTEKYENKAMTLSKTGGGFLRRRVQSSTTAGLTTQTCYVPPSSGTAGKNIQMNCACV